MNFEPLFRELLAQLSGAAIYSQELPDETAESTLKALWNTVSGNNCSAQRSNVYNLPELTLEQATFLRSLLIKRINGTPLPCLTGRVHFMGLELLYEPGVLVPRPETELLGFTTSDVIDHLGAGSDTILGIDVGCGCGNVSCGIASRHRNLRLMSIDITESCVATTAKNVAFLQLQTIISVYLGDLFSPLTGLQLEGTVDFVVSNPPYIPSVKLRSDHSYLLDYEPKEAFDGGVYGFSVHQRLIRESLTMLKPGGYLLFEFGQGQEKQVQALFKRIAGYESVEFKHDTNNNPRVAIARKKVC